MKVYELIIPRWDAVIPKEWNLEVAVRIPNLDDPATAPQYTAFESVAGQTIAITQGARLRTGGGDLKTIEPETRDKDGNLERPAVQIGHGEELLERMLVQQFVQEVGA